MYCVECGGPLPPDARYCIRCGTPTSGAGTVTLAGSNYTIAGFGRRFAGHLIDYILVGGPFFVVSMVVVIRGLTSDCDATARECFNDNIDVLRTPAFLVLTQLIPFLYWALFDSLGTSPGRWLAGVKIVTRDGQRPGIRRGALRALVSQFASARVLFLGYLWVLWDRERRTWHDHAAKTWAVRR